MAGTYTEELVELKLAVATIPELREDVKELIRSIKGNNGNIGLVARVVQNEGAITRQTESMKELRTHYKESQAEINTLLNTRFDGLLSEILTMSGQKVERMEEKEDDRSEEERDKRKDYRNFWIGLGLGLVPQLADWLWALVVPAK